ncbi:ATP-binding protein [Antarctobacter jejuensis]|uniref:ATP-binding protein n=1 Tax=Antarctobacter jejuensis TaxID=1439938 RepID=UPI003FD2CB19
MFGAMIDSLLALPLLAALLYFALAHRGSGNGTALRTILLVAAFGLSALVTMRGSYQLPGGDGAINGIAGVLLFAGYVGGPLVGVLTLFLSSMARIGMGGELAIVSLGAQTAYVVAGLLLRWLVPAQRWPEPPAMVLVYALGLFVALHSLGLAWAASLGHIPDYRSAEPVLAISYLVTALSIILVWLAVRKVAQLTEQTRMVNIRQDQMQIMFETAGIGTFSYDPDKGLFVFDQSLIDLYGLNMSPGPNEIDEPMALLHPEDREELSALIPEMISGKSQRTSVKARFILKSGETQISKIVWQIRRGRDGRATQIIGMHMNITDFEKMSADRENALQRLEQFAESFPGVLQQGLWLADRPLKLLYLSPNCKDFWGYTPEEIYADRSLFGAHEDPEIKERIFSAIRQGIATGKPIYGRATATNPSGQMRWLDYHGRATDLGDGTYRVDGVWVDVSAEVEALAEADRQANLASRAQRVESIGQLTGGVAHDFNNLLAVVMGNLELLREELDDPDHLSKVDAGLEATRRGADLTRSMLAFARRAPLDPEPLDLNQVIRQSKNWMHRAIPATVEIESSLLAGLWPVRLDAASLESALLNLLLNARDAMDGRGKLTIETANVRIDEAYVDARDKELNPGRYVMLAVTDTGSGIPEDKLKQIFDPFFSTKGPGKGSGLGLSMVEGFVKQSKGTVQVYTEPGQGTTFKLYFPAAASAAATTPDTKAPAHVPDQGGANILLVEDDSAVRDVLAQTLRGAGYRVAEAASGDDALALFQADQGFDLLVTDIVMPGTLQGTDLARSLRKLAPDLPRIFMSGYAAEATVHGNGLLPEDIRLMKPVPRADLLRAVNQALVPGDDTAT